MRLLIEVLPRQPCTWAQPVSPDFTRWRSMYCGISLRNLRTNAGRSGRGPTIDMSPRKMFQSWGSSSSDQRRRKAPMRVRRGSSSIAHTGPVVDSALARIERNLRIMKERPSSPIRSCR